MNKQDILELAKHPTVALTGRVENWLKDPEGRLPVSCTVLAVQDRMDGRDGIEDSWAFTSKALRYGAGVAIDLSALRPAGTVSPNATASGAASFAKIYSDIARVYQDESLKEMLNHLQTLVDDLSGNPFARLYSGLNEILRRGGRYKNGAVNLHLDSNHPDALEFIQIPSDRLPWAKRTLTVHDNLLELPYLDEILKQMRSGTLWLSKARHHNGQRLYGNVCVAGDTWVHTTEGSRQVRELIGVPFVAVIDGKEYPSTSQGFWSNGFKPVVEISTTQGYSVKATHDHKFLVVPSSMQGKKIIRENPVWKKAGKLSVGDRIVLNNVGDFSSWEGKGTFEQGWLIGMLVGNGTFSDKQTAILPFWGSTRKEMLSRAIELLDEGIGTSVHRRGGHQEKYDKSVVTSRGLAQYAQTLGIARGSKTLNELIESGSSDFIRGVLQGYYDADGTVNLGTSEGNGRCVSITSVVLSNMEIVQRCLLRLGIVSRLRKNKYGDKLTQLPDGKGGSAFYQSRPASRLDIMGQKNILRFASLVNFSKPDKQEKLSQLVLAYESGKNRTQQFEANVLKVVEAGVEEVFDCTIPEAHRFAANGLIAHNCNEIYLRSRGTCLLQHVNLGMCQIGDIPAAFEHGMKMLCSMHPITGVGDSGIYLSPEIDKQVGLGVIGLASLLAIEGISYLRLVEAWEYLLKTGTPPRTKAGELAMNIVAGITRAAAIAKAHGMERSLTIAPTASCAYRYEDRDGYTTTPEISPPIAKEVDRYSGTFGIQTYDHHPRVETALETGYDTYFRLADCWQTTMNRTGQAHAISFNIWDTQEIDRPFLARWKKSSLPTTYYRLAVKQQEFLDKTIIQQSSETPENPSCGLDSGCAACGE